MTYPEEVNKNIFTDDSLEGTKLRERLAAVGMEWFDFCKNQRLPQERQWRYNLAFYGGNQHSQLHKGPSGTYDFRTPSAPYYRVRIVVNQIRKIIRKEISRLTAQKPNAFVVPSSTEDQDVFAAQAGEQIWDSLWRRIGFAKTLREAVFWQAVCGTGYLKSYWDKTKKDKDSSTNENTVYGDICIENISPFYIFVPDLLLTDIELQPYVIHAQIRNLSWVRQTFGIETTDASLDSVDEGMTAALEVEKNLSKKNQTTVLEVWVKPDYLPELPKGGMFIIAANKVVDGFEGWPYGHDQYPFAKLDATLTGKFYSASIIEDLIPLQQELNRTRGQLIEAKNKMAKPQLMAAKGSVDPKKITSEPGLVIEYNLGMDPPQPLPLQGIPSYVTEELERLYNDMADISGQHEVSNGSTPPGVTAATAISFLQEQDESLIAANYSSIEEAIEKIAYQSLSYVKDFWDESRLVKIVGTEGVFDVMTFKGSDLRGNTDIRVESGSALPTSKAAKQAFIMDLMKMGFIPPDEGLEILEVGGLNRIYERVQVDKRQAQRENLKMRAVTDEQLRSFQAVYIQEHPDVSIDSDTGLPLDAPLIIPVHSYDNHDLHIQIHNAYRKSQNFENAPDATKILFEEHVRQHMEASAGMMQHPLTGMDPSNPSAPDPEEEQMMMDQMEQEGAGEQTGPEAMPQVEEGTA